MSDDFAKQRKRVPAIFFRTEAGGEPVREWLRVLSKDDRRRVGEDIRTVELGWPIGMPTCRPLKNGLHGVRTNLTGRRIGRVLFYVDAMRRMVLLHAFIKKTQSTPETDIEIARRNKNKHARGVS
jgi:phage-related protein